MNKGQFTRERSLGNKNAVGNPPNKTSFVKGQVPKSFKGFGVPRTLLNKGLKEVIVTTTDKAQFVSRGRVYNTHKRTSYGRFLMSPPVGMIVYHKDGDPENNELSNLEVISRGELLKRNRERRRYEATGTRTS